MSYLAIVLVTYIIVGFVVFYWMSERMARTAERMKANGMTQANIDKFYKEMGGATLVTLFRTMMVTGTPIAVIACLVWWFVR